MAELRPYACPISGLTASRRVHVYSAPPRGEIGFKRPAGEAYYRELWQFDISNHFVSRHAMSVAAGYTEDYVSATYADEQGMLRTFNRIIALPPEKSDNAGRIERLRIFAAAHFSKGRDIDVLDVGSGLGVFPHAVRQVGWRCTALDPDQRAVRHLQNNVGVEAMRGDFMTTRFARAFDIVTFNKVLEHVEDPVAMLQRAREILKPDGFIYVELPDGEMAARDGFHREEFFIEHLHVFSFESIAMLADRAGYAPLAVERLREPSSKYTLRAFCAPLIN